MRPRSSITPVLVAGIAVLLGGLAWLILSSEPSAVSGPNAATAGPDDALDPAEAGPAVQPDAVAARKQGPDSSPGLVPPSVADRPAPPYDYRHLPQPFEGVVQRLGGVNQRRGGPVADAVLRYGGRTGRTDAQGRFHFPTFGFGRLLRVQPPSGAAVIVLSSSSQQVIRLPPEMAARVEVDSEVHQINGEWHRVREVEGIPVRIHLAVRVDFRVGFLDDCEVVGRAVTDASGIAHFPELSAVPGDDGTGLLYAVAELPEGGWARCFVGRRPGRGGEKDMWSGRVRIASSLPTRLRVERRSPTGRQPVPNLEIQYRTDGFWMAPWNRARTDAYGEVVVPWVEIREWEVMIPLESGGVWTSKANPLVDMGDHWLALLEDSRPRSIRLEAPGAPSGVRFEVMRASRDPDGRLVEVESPTTGRLEKGDWTPCPLGQEVLLPAEVPGPDEAVLVRAVPGGPTLHVAPLEPEGLTVVTLPPLCQLTVRSGERALLPRGSRLWLFPEAQRPGGLRSLVFPRTTLGSFQAIVPQGAYTIRVHTTAGVSLPDRDLVLDRARVDVDLDLEPREQTLRLSFDGQPLAQRPVTVESGEVQELRTAADGRLRFVNLTPGSCRLRVPPDATLPPIQVPAEGAELVRFLGWDAEVSLPSAEVGVTTPVASLNLLPGNAVSTDFRLARLEEDGSPGAGVAIHFASRDAALTLRLPAGRYRLQAEGSPEVEELDLGANTRTEFTWNDD